MGAKADDERNATDMPKPPSKKRGPKIIYRIAGCPHCLKYNKVPATVWVYRCGHCDGRIDATPEAR